MPCRRRDASCALPASGVLPAQRHRYHRWCAQCATLATTAPRAPTMQPSSRAPLARTSQTTAPSDLATASSAQRCVQAATISGIHALRTRSCRSHDALPPTLQGFYCVNATGDYWAYPCPAGYYCPDGTTARDAHACPAGTYNPATGATNVTACTMNPCPVGKYCMAGTNATAGTPCPRGTYNPSQGAGDFSGCIACDPGTMCNTTGLSAPSGTCLAGYYCPIGTITATQVRCKPSAVSPVAFCTRHP